MFDSILLAVDGSETSGKAIPIAADVAKRYGAEVVVLHVREREVSVEGAFDLETGEEAADLVDDAVRNLKDAGLSARGEVRTTIIGQVPRVVAEVASDEGAGLIVMGSRGLSDWGGLFLGSVTHRVLHMVEVPVLVVR